MEAEFVTKAAAEAEILKATEAAVDVVKQELQVQVDLVKALQAEIETFKAAEVAAIEKARKEALGKVVAADKVEVLYKSLAALEQADFEAVVETFKAAAAAEATNEMFNEAGVDGDKELNQEVQDQTAAILKAKYAKQ